MKFYGGMTDSKGISVEDSQSSQEETTRQENNYYIGKKPMNSWRKNKQRPNGEDLTKKGFT